MLWFTGQRLTAFIDDFQFRSDAGFRNCLPRLQPNATGVGYGVAALKIVLPEVLPFHFGLWFISIESEFRQKLSTQVGRYDSIIAAYSKHMIITVQHILYRPPGYKPYDHWRLELIRRTSEFG